ncbi:O-antigen ligase family protein [Candidatus Pelagibacter bacterium]|nr:O-antigen ligase family protein [Candidatus Pelagibacter bacterium]
MNLFSKLQISKINYLSVLVALFPVSFIIGNMAININIILLIISCFFFYKYQTFKLNYFFIDKIVLIFFLFIVVTGIYNDFKLYINHNEFYTYRGSPLTTIKSVLFLKYLFFYIVLRFLIEKKDLNINLFLITCMASTLFVCFDIILQYFYGKDLFGFEPQEFGRRFSGPFGNELIAGGYIQRFSILSFFAIILIGAKNSNKLIKYLLPIFFLIFSFAIILSGNRMPMLIFLMTIVLLFIFTKKIRIYFIPSIVLFSLIFFTLFKSNDQIKTHFLDFEDKISKIVVAIINKDFENKDSSQYQYLEEFLTFYDTWLMNKYMGGGIKNFRFYCHERPNIDLDNEFVCNMHPHNYYLEIMTETGLVGLAITTTLFLVIIYATLIRKYFLNSNLNNNFLITPFIFLFIAEIFPIKSTGSFYTTGNTTYLFLIIGIMVGLLKKNNLIENKY